MKILFCLSLIGFALGCAGCSTGSQANDHMHDPFYRFHHEFDGGRR